MIFVDKFIDRRVTTARQIRILQEKEKSTTIYLLWTPTV